MASQCLGNQHFFEYGTTGNKRRQHGLFVGMSPKENSDLEGMFLNCPQYNVWGQELRAAGLSMGVWTILLGGGGNVNSITT